MSRVVAALYAFAADPDRWDELVDVLADLPEELALSAEVASALTPHLTQAVQIAERLSPDLPPAPPATLPLCGLVLDADRRLLMTFGDIDPLCERLIAPPVKGARLHFLDSENEARLRAAIADLPPVGGSSLLQLYDGADRALRLAVVVRVDADRRRQLDLGPGGPVPPAGALAILLPGGSPAIRSDALLRDGFGLTAAETRLVRRLEDGLSLQEAAGVLGIRLNTARNQLKSVFDKMGVRRQSELVKHLMELATIARYMPGDAPAAPHPRRTPGDQAGGETLRRHELPDGRQLSYRRYGRPGGRPVLTLHMWGGATLLPPGTPALAERLDLDLVSVARPGYDGASPVADMNVTAHAADLGHLLDTLDMPAAQVLAISAGAAYALGLALAAPTRVERLFLLTPRPTGRDNWRGGERTGWHHFRDYLVRFPGVADAMCGIISRTMTRESIVRTIRRLGQGCAKDQQFFADHPEQFNYLVDVMFGAAKQSMAGMRDELKYSARDERLDLTDLAPPLTIWHDSEDPVIPADAFLRQLPATLQPDLRLFEGHGHYLWVRRWQDILRALADWPAATRHGPGSLLSGQPVTA